MPVSPTDDLIDNAAGEALEVSNNVEAIDQGSQGVDNASSPAATNKQDEKAPSMVDAVKAALNPGEEQSSGSGDSTEVKNSADAAKVGKDGQAGEEEDLGEITDEELKGYHSKTRRRVKQLVGKAKSLEEEVQTLKPVAERMGRIENFVKENQLTETDMNVMFTAAATIKKSGLSNEEFESGVVIMDAMRNDPERAYELLAPVFHSLQAIVGEVLPPDLREQVNKGQLTEETARELSRARASKVITTTKTQTQQERQTLESRTKETSALADAVANGVSTFEKNWKSRDPDYRVKATLWQNAMEAQIGRGWVPKSAKEAVEMAEKCKKEVEENLKRVRPVKPAIRTTPTGVGSSTGAKAAPSSMLDAIKGALQAS